MSGPSDRIRRLLHAALFIGIVVLLVRAVIVVSQQYNWEYVGFYLIFGLLIVLVGEAFYLYIFSPSTGSTGGSTRPHWGYALTLGTYLVALQVLLVYLSAVVWLTPGIKIISWFVEISNQLEASQFRLLQDLILSACAAGLGGAVFMVREFYINYCFGRDKKNTKGQLIEVDGVAVKEYLEPAHLPRYFLLPLSSIILGPIVLSLMMAGKISLDVDAAVSRPTIVAVCFVLGFSYHDTLRFMTNLSKQIFSPK